MAMMYIRQSRRTSRQQGRLIEHCMAGSTAWAAAAIVGVQPKTVIRFFMDLRQLIASKLPGYHLCGEVEADDSYLKVSARVNGDTEPVARGPYLGN